MDLSKELPEAICMSWEDEEWLQTLYYQKIHFRCRRCQEYGHLFRDFSMNNPKVGWERREEDQKDQGFTKVPSHKRGGQMTGESGYP